MPIRSTNFDAASLASLRQAKYVQTNAAHVQAQMKLGKRIVNVKDDASGASIAANLKARNAGANEGVRNLQEASAALGIAENALNILAEKLNNLKALGVRAATGLKTQEARDLIKREITEIKAGLVKAIEVAEYNGKKVLTGGINAAQVNYGIGSLQFSVEKGTLLALGLGAYMRGNGAGAMVDTTLTGAASWICSAANGDARYRRALSAGLGEKLADAARNMATAALTRYLKNHHCFNISSALDEVGYTWVTKTNAFIETVENAVSQLSTMRGNLGATQVLIDSTIESVQSNIDKTDEARSTIEDIDSLEAQVKATTAQSQLNLAVQAFLLSMQDNFKNASIGMQTMATLMQA